MNVAMDKLCRVFSRGLNIIEEEQLGVSRQHCARVSALVAIMGKYLGYDDDAISALATCALFHDNALTEYNISEDDLKNNSKNAIYHCRTGQDNVSWLPFEKDISGYILYHHEIEDGSGPFGKKPGEYPFEAALLAAADSTDATYDFASVENGRLSAIRDEIKACAGTFSACNAVDVLLEILDSNVLDSLRDDKVSQTLDSVLPRWELAVNEQNVTAIANFFAHIIDCKSRFTRKHTSQIANRAWLMAGNYNYSSEDRAAIFLAASLHDLGKLATPTAVLEKPGKLDPDEFNIIKKHVKDTHDWLCEVPDFEMIRDWAADHHEKLDGTGYSFGKTSDMLDKSSRLLACIDIYQAVCEERPYHEARSHEDTMPILRSMADKGFIDSNIVADLDDVMEEYSLQDVPPPGNPGSNAG